MAAACERALSELDRPQPDEVLSRAWRRVTESGVAGSCTALVVTLRQQSNKLTFARRGTLSEDASRRRLRDVDRPRRTRRGDAAAFATWIVFGEDLFGRYCSLGDCGVVVLRATELAGTAGMAAARDGARRAPVLVAAQQLRDFNLPYQLGWTNEGGTRPFETPAQARRRVPGEGGARARASRRPRLRKGGRVELRAQANIGSFPVHVGDVVVIATDGLFDNVAVDDVAEVCEAWERGPDSDDRHALARSLCERARALSLDDAVDSPFALLAKENDIMWGGGMPDDVTVVCLTVEASGGEFRLG